MRIFKRRPRITTTGRVERIGIDVRRGVEGRDTIWLVKLEGADRIHAVRDKRAPDGHLPLTRIGDDVTITQRGRKILAFANSNLSPSLPS